MIGPQPPPIHGMATVNAAVLSSLRNEGMSPLVINLAARDLGRSLLARLSRLPRVLLGFIRLASGAGGSGSICYLSVSGGAGQFIEIIFVVLARLRAMRVVLHHHSFSYIDQPRWLTRVLCRAAGSSARHVVQSPQMAAKFVDRYRVRVVEPVSNAAFLDAQVLAEGGRPMLGTVGFLSNISVEKGILEFLDLCECLQQQAGVRALLAGPFQDVETEVMVRERLRLMPHVKYLGPVYGVGKRDFFQSIDVLVFPTRYRHETEGIVNIEAMASAVPVIAYGRGCIPELVKSEWGCVIDPATPFTDAALRQIGAWQSDPQSYRDASLAARRAAGELFARARIEWSEVLAAMTGDATKATGFRSGVGS